MMRKILSICAVLVFMVGCGVNTSPNETTKMGHAKQIANKNKICVDTTNGYIVDGTYLAALDFSTLSDDKINVILYEKEIFDARDIASLSINDTIITKDDEVIVKTLNYNNGLVIVNENKQNLQFMTSDDGNSYFMKKNMNDSYVKMLEGNISISEDVTFSFDGKTYSNSQMLHGLIDIKGLFCDRKEATIEIVDNQIISMDIEKNAVNLKELIYADRSKLERYSENFKHII